MGSLAAQYAERFVRAQPVGVAAPPRPSVPLRVFLPFVAAFLLLAAVAVYGALQSSTVSLSAPGGKASVVWGDGLFSNRAELRAWLKQHGASYSDWVKTHPAARALLPAAQPLAAKPVNSSTAEPTRSQAQVSPATAPATTVKKHSHLLSWLAIAVGILLGLIAIIPGRLAERAGLWWLAEEREVRLGVAGVGAALLVGVAFATL